MAIIGIPTEWADLIDPMVPDILCLVVACWEVMQPPAADELEDRITEKLCRLLRQHRTERDLPFQIHTQFVELEPANNEKLGRLDIVFLPTVNHEEYYFCLECKRLNVIRKDTTRPYASEYVSFGMKRFVTGQYSKSVRHGGMMGYVLDGNVRDAMAKVEANVQSHASALHMQHPVGFQPSAILQNDYRFVETHHYRTQEPSPFRIHHLFMARPA